jgi:hypothetical protein
MLFKKPNVIFKPRPIITLISFIIKIYNKTKNTSNKLNVVLLAMQATTATNFKETFIIYENYF